MEVKHSAQDWPSTHFMDDLEVQAAARVLAARSPFRYYGPNLQREVEQFEREFADSVGTRFCVGVASGTAALQVALAAMGIGPGDEVIVPGYFWVSTAAAVVRSGAIPRLADIDDSFCLDPEDLQRKITSHTKAVIVVHMGGVMGRVEHVADICKQNGLLLLEDCAQSAGATKSGRSCGTFGDAAVFSFQLNKSLSAGEGGAIVTNDEALFNKAVLIHDLGYSRDPDGRPITDDTAALYWGIGCRMSEVTGAVLRVQLVKLPWVISHMRGLKLLLRQVIAQYPNIKLRAVDDVHGDAGTLLTLTFDSKATAKAFQASLSRNSILVKKTRLTSTLMSDWGLHIYYRNKSLVDKRSICGHHSVWELQENAFARDYFYGKGTLPILDDVASRTLLFPIPVGLDERDTRELIRMFERSCRHVVIDRS